MTPIQAFDRTGMDRVCGFVNGKGGVLKTTLTANVGALLASSDWRVLLIDMDPQGNLGLDLGYRHSEFDDDGAGLAQSLMFGSKLVPLKNVRPNLDVVPGGAFLDQAAAGLVSLGSKDPSKAKLGLARSLASIASEYDIIFIDCPRQRTPSGRCARGGRICNRPHQDRQGRTRRTHRRCEAPRHSPRRESKPGSTWSHHHGHNLNRNQCASNIDLEELVEDIATAMGKSRSGFGIFIDEMQDLDEELLGALISVQHLAGQKGWPFFIIGAGLPNLPGKLSATRSYSERLFDYRTFGALDHASAADAISLPMNRLGAHLEADALRALVTAADGYPFFLQAYGKAVWDVSSSKTVNLDDARLAIEIGTEQLDAGFFRSRWQRATPAERQYLRAMAEDHDEASSTAQVASRLNRAASQLTVARSSLISKGLIYAPDHGAVRFTVPGMSGFISRQYEE